MANCTECRKTLKGWESRMGGTCSNCYSKVAEQVIQKDNSQRLEELDAILVTTAHTLQGIEVTKYLGFVSTECAYGMNMFKDMFANVRNLVGGRSTAVEDTMRDSRETVLLELKREAYAKGANAVIAVNLDYTQLGAGGNMMVLVTASGTAVVIETKEVAL